jgi:hypothetical protein
MNFKVVLAVSIFTALPIVANAKQNRLAANAPEPTVADVQKLVQMISGDKAKLKAYCETGKVHEQIEKAEEKGDEKAIEALRAKANSLAEQIGPEYMQVMDGVEEVDPLSAEGEQFEAVFNSLDKQCK